MRFRSHIAILLSAAVVGIIQSPRAADAVLVQLTFSGTYDTFGETVFGESGSAVPFSYELTFDTDLAPPPVFIATGEDMGAGRTADHEMYGYSRSGVTASSFVFGTKAWDWWDDVVPMSLVGSGAADLWLDSAIGYASPYRLAIMLSDADGDVELGGQRVAGLRHYMGTGSILQAVGLPSAMASSHDLEVTSEIVPEPATFAMWIVAAASFLAIPWRRRGR